MNLRATWSTLLVKGSTVKSLPIGSEFERLKTIGEPFRYSKYLYKAVVCECKCGNFVVKQISSLRNGDSTSCGCLKRERIGNANRRHGMSMQPLYRVWSCLKARCRNKVHRQFSDYGGRGIDYCQEWESFEVFAKWAIASGYNPGLQIDRYPNNDGNYEPANCRWATRIENCRNKRNTPFVTAWGERKPLVEWANDPRCVVSYQTLRRRLREVRQLKWTPERAITTPIVPITNRNPLGENTHKRQ